MPKPSPVKPEPSTRCWQCGNDVPAAAFCVVCGNTLADELTARKAARRYSAAPEESAVAVRILSTLFPQLPRRDLEAFRIAFGLGVGAVLVLAVVGLYSVAVVAAAVIVPLLVVLYLYDVDVYEDEPVRIIGATMLWGAAAGVGVALITRALGEAATSGTAALDPATLLREGIALPLVQLAAMLVGPLALLRYRRFNDVLDGATFGVASAAAFSGAYTLVTAFDLLGAGLTPAGEPLVWALTSMTIAVFRPLLLAGAVGSACAAFWLRYRAPVTDRAALGFVGMPWAAVALAALLLVGNAAAGIALEPAPATLIRIALAAAGFVWLRRAIHLGLLQEARESPIGPSIECANCGRETAHHSFCGHCGISLRALPKGPPRRPATPQVPQGTEH